ncbi:MAG: DUF4258 domain-containing protein [Anaerolineae bacterium]|nr:DUF4258 domain-containing protein [Anaerolineae bacterium]
MIIRDIEDLLAFRETLRISNHALREAHKESLRAEDIFYALFNGAILEHYHDRQRILIAGPIRKTNLHVHVVCDYSDRNEVVIATVYIPDKPKWLNDLARGHQQWKQTA